MADTPEDVPAPPSSKTWQQILNDFGKSLGKDPLPSYMNLLMFYRLEKLTELADLARQMEIEKRQEEEGNDEEEE